MGISISTWKLSILLSFKIRILERRKRGYKLFFKSSRLRMPGMWAKAATSGTQPPTLSIWLSTTWDLKNRPKMMEMIGLQKSQNPKRTPLLLWWKNILSFSFSQTCRKFVRLLTRFRKCKMTLWIFLRISNKSIKSCFHKASMIGLRKIIGSSSRRSGGDLLMMLKVLPQRLTPNR